MKALASADLDSHLQLAQQFLNMGKPYSFEGIGILTKVKPGEFEFTPIAVPTDKIKEHQKTETAEAAPKDESAEGYESFLSLPKANFEWRKPVIALLLVCGIAGTIWGGYVISKRNSNKMMTAAEQEIPQTIVPDSTRRADSIAALKEAVAAVPDTYKYVLEVAKKKRAIKRYNQLKDIRWKVELETQDSIQYKLFMLLPALSDTNRTIDSLTVMTGRKVYIEYP